MKNKPVFACQHRVIISDADLSAIVAQCERTEDCVIMPGGERLDRLTFRGVPARIVDVTVPQGAEASARPKRLVLEIETKLGRYDGAERQRLNVRRWSSYCDDLPVQFDAAVNKLVPIPEGRVYFVRASDLLLVTVVWTGGSWSMEFPTLRSDLINYDVGKIVMWHWQNYYKFLPHEEALSVAVEFATRKEEFVSAGLTLAEANRMASRELYRLARNLGWRKMTLRERQAYHLTGQWHRTEDVSRRRVEMGYSAYSDSGCGEYTIDAANGRAMRGPVEPDRVEEYGDDEYRTSYGLVEGL